MLERSAGLVYLTRAQSKPLLAIIFKALSQYACCGVRNFVSSQQANLLKKKNRNQMAYLFVPCTINSKIDYTPQRCFRAHFEASIDFSRNNL